jgi:hypothetical protein
MIPLLAVLCLLKKDCPVPLCSFHCSKSVVPVLSNGQAWMHCSSALSQGMHLCRTVSNCVRGSKNSKISKSNPTTQLFKPQLRQWLRCKGTSLRLLSQSGDSWEQDVNVGGLHVLLMVLVLDVLVSVNWRLNRFKIFQEEVFWILPNNNFPEKTYLL